MADPTNVTVQDPNNDKWTKFAEILKNAKDDASLLNDRISSVMGGVKPIKIIDDSQKKGIDSVTEAFKNLTKVQSSELRSLTGDWNRFSEKAKDLKLEPQIGEDGVRELFNKLKEEGARGGKAYGEAFTSSFGGFLVDLPEKLGQGLSFISKAINISNFRDTLGSAAIIMAAHFSKKLTDAIGEKTGLYAAQALLLPIQKAAYQAGAAAGESLTTIQGNLKDFQTNISKGAILSGRSIEDVTNTTKELAMTMGSVNVGLPIKIEPIGMLAEKLGEVNAKLTNTNAALLLSSATGLESSKVTQMMLQSYTELGSKAEDMTDIFGTMKEIVEKSGIGWEKTSASIMNSADALKMWGGTVSGVTPLFKMFSDSLSEGRKGLAPQLLERFISGINTMGISTRAFLGIQAGMGGRSGVIGGGLEMEAALEEGPQGMKKVVSGLTDTLKQFTGGQLITRKEAIADPTLQTGFLVQRQLLMQMLKLDEASATKTIDALVDMQKSGMQVGSDSAKALQDLITVGKKTVDDTTGTQKEVAVRMEAAITSAADRIIESVKDLKGNVGLERPLQRLNADLAKVTATGVVDKKELSEVYNELIDYVSKIGKSVKTAEQTIEKAKPDLRRKELEREKEDALKGKARRPEQELKGISEQFGINLSSLQQAKEKLAEMARKSPDAMIGGGLPVRGMQMMSEEFRLKMTSSIGESISQMAFPKTPNTNQASQEIRANLIMTVNGSEEGKAVTVTVKPDKEAMVDIAKQTIRSEAGGRN